MKKIFLVPSVLWIPIKTRNIWIIYLDVCRFQFLSWDLAHCIYALACSVFGGRLALGWERSFETPDTWGAGALALPHGSTHCAHRPGGSTTQAPSAALPHPTGFSRRLQSGFLCSSGCVHLMFRAVPENVTYHVRQSTTSLLLWTILYLWMFSQMSHFSKTSVTALSLNVATKSACLSPRRAALRTAVPQFPFWFPVWDV